MTIIHRCVPVHPDHATFLADVWYWLDNAKFIVLPSTILISSSIAIVYLVIRSRQRVLIGHFKHSENDDLNIRTTGHGAGTTGPSFPQTSIAFDRKIRLQNSAYCMKNKQRSIIPRKEISVTITLMAINIVFLVCNTPVIIYFLGTVHGFDCGGCPAQRLMFMAAIMVMYTSNAINFLLYCATGSKFRAELRIMFVSLFKIKTN